MVVGMAGEERDGVSLTNLDQPLFDGAGATKRDLVDYLDAVSERIIPVLRDRPLSVIRVLRGQAPFMQKNLPRYAPDWVRSVTLWAESSHRDVSYALCDDRRTLLWFANQRAVEYHPTLVTAGRTDHVTHLVLDIDPPVPDALCCGGPGAHLVRQALDDAGLAGAVKTSGAKGVHVFVPVEPEVAVEDVAAATRALAARAERIDPVLATTAFIREDREGKVFVDSTRAGGATVVAAYSPRVRPGCAGVVPGARGPTWTAWHRPTSPCARPRPCSPTVIRGPSSMPAPQRLPDDLIAEGHTIPVARVAAMHEGKRRARAKRG